MGQPVSRRKLTDCPEPPPRGVTLLLRIGERAAWDNRPEGMMQSTSATVSSASSRAPSRERTSDRTSSVVQYRDGRPDIYQTVTDRIVAALESGVVPWVCPWTGATPALLALPRNGATHRAYAGVNVLLLWLTAVERGYRSNEWYTMRQANTVGAQVRKGEHGTLVTFWRQFTIPDRSEAAPDGAERTVPMLRYYVVFNREQLDGLPASEIAPDALSAVVDRVDEIDEFVRRTDATVIERPDAPVPCYLPALDRIEMPALVRFASREEFYNALMHEIGHWVGHSSRLARPMTGMFGTPSYAREELVAELSAAFLCADFQLPGNLQHPEYIAHWITVLREDSRAVFRAARDARNVTAYLYELTGTTPVHTDSDEEHLS